MKYTFKLPSASCSIVLPTAPLPFRRLKITKIHYISTNDQETGLFFDINGYGQNVYYDGVNVIQYVYYMPICVGANIYSNPHNTWDIEYLDETCATYFQINILGRNMTYSPYITFDNPLTIEIEIN